MTWKGLESDALQLAVPAVLPTKVMVQKACQKAARHTVKVSGNRCVMFRLTCGSFVSESNRRFHNFSESGFLYKTWELYIYVCISSCIISQKPLEWVRYHKTSFAVNRGIFNPLGKTAHNKKTSPDFREKKPHKQKQESRRYSSFLFILVFFFFFHSAYW